MPAGAAVEEAHKLLAEGFQAAKIRVGRPDARGISPSCARCAKPSAIRSR
jgi:L-alanine-DL-glutamate epimerase-like enolase superfamily enzyme